MRTRIFTRKNNKILSLTVEKQKTVVKPVKSMLAAVFCFVAICAIKKVVFSYDDSRNRKSENANVDRMY